MNRILLVILISALWAGLSGCGQSGPLYLPDSPGKTQKQEAQSE